MANAKVYHAVGKRKTSVARVYMKNGKGGLSVNQKDAKEYFPVLFYNKVIKAFSVLEGDLGKTFDVNINVFGGGTSSQAEACMYGIAKTLTLVDAANRPPLKKADLLTRDSRVVERKKYGHKKARKSFQFSKR